MSKTRLRPRFRIISNLSQEEVLNKIKSRLNNKRISVEGQIAQEHAFLRIRKKDQHYWSPELHIWVRKQNNKTIIYGVVGPKPPVWTMFMFFYGLIISVSFFGSIYGFIQWNLGMDAPFLWSIALGILGVILVFMAARFGQWKGRQQMQLLRDFLDDALESNSA